VPQLLARPLQPQECFRFPLTQRWNQAPDLFFTIANVGIDFGLVTQVEGNGAVDLLQRKSRELLLMVSGLSPERKAYTSESKDTRVPAT
jgi:hypothetical protein